MKKLFILIVLAYPMGYAAFRTIQAETRDLDGLTYVIYPAQAAWLYYTFRPIAYLDAWLTGMNSHLGPHPEEAAR